MKMLLPSIIAALGLIVFPLAAVGSFEYTEHRITDSTFYETTPTLGHDGTSNLVVYTSRELLNTGAFDQADIYYRRLDAGGAPTGNPVQVTTSLTDDVLNDISGDYIVYTAFDDTHSTTGSIMLFNISTGQLRAIGDAGYVREPRIHNNYVIWLQGVFNATEVILYDINTDVWQSLSGPVPPAFEVQIGSRFAVWASQDGDFDIEVFDFELGARYAITNTPMVHDRSPSTSGDWIAWQAIDVDSPLGRIEAYNGRTGELRVIVDDGAANRLPSLDDGIITWEGKSSGFYDVFVHRLSSNETFPITIPGAQYINDIHGDLVAYVDMRSGDEDIYVAKLQLPAHQACAGPTTGLQGCYSFEGDGYDGSGNGRPGTLQGSPTFTEDRNGNAGGALLLDGIDDYVSLPTGFPVNGAAITLSATLKVPDYSQDNWLISNGTGYGNYSLRILPQDQAFWPGYAGYAHDYSGGNWSYHASNAPVPTNQFFQLTVSRDAVAYKAYVNGNLVQQAANPPGPFAYMADVIIGGGGNNGLTDFFLGAIDEMRLYDRALTDAEQCELYNNTFNTPPVANAGTDQTVHAGSVVTLDGSASADPEQNYPLSYAWRIDSMPAGSAAALSGDDSATPSLATDLAGDYVVELVATDHCGLQGAADTVNISTTNSAPVADAGPDQAVIVLGSTITLDGSGSYDDDGDDFTYAWVLDQVPTGSAAMLLDADTASPHFLADVQGEYLAKLTVTDVLGATNTDTVTVSFDNVTPVANAGTSQSAVVGDTVSLDGSNSHDANGDPLTYSWVFASIPGGSAASLTGANTAVAQFVPDMAGLYVVQLTVNDGIVDSVPDTVQVQVIAQVTYAIEAVQDIQSVIDSLDPGLFKNDNNKNAVNNMLNAVIGKIVDGEYGDARDKLANSILAKTDGCAETGEPDKNDWIRDCESQALVYPAILEAIARLEALIP